MTRCDSFHKLPHSEYILICQLPKEHGGKHTFGFVWVDEPITSLTDGEGKN